MNKSNLFVFITDENQTFREKRIKNLDFQQLNVKNLFDFISSRHSSFTLPQQPNKILHKHSTRRKFRRQSKIKKSTCILSEKTGKYQHQLGDDLSVIANNLSHMMKEHRIIDIRKPMYQ